MSQSIEMVVRIDITVSQPIEIPRERYNCVTANCDSFWRDLTVSLA